MEMFRLLDLPRTMTLENLTFGDIIKVADKIIENADAIKVSTRTHRDAVHISLRYDLGFFLEVN